MSEFSIQSHENLRFLWICVFDWWQALLVFIPVLAENSEQKQ
jgi:hypothetical protein